MGALPPVGNTSINTTSVSISTRFACILAEKEPKEILLSALARMAEQAPFYIFTAFVFSYGIGTLNVSRDFLLFGPAA